MSRTSDSSCKDSASKSNNDGLCELVGKLQNMSTFDHQDNDIVSVCANCGKEGANNVCNKCKATAYCNAVCKKVHRKKHKKECEEYIRLATEKHNEELRIAAELYDEKLFRPPPPADDCPICFVLIPSLGSGSKYMSCCGKVICSGCYFAPVYDNQGNEVSEKACSFCRTSIPTSEEEAIERNKERMKVGDPIAIGKMGSYYRDGSNGFPQNINKALELWQRSAELGYVRAYNSIGLAYNNGEGMERDNKKAVYYYELGAMGGDETARCNLGIDEAKAGNMDRAVKHFMIAISSGDNGSLKTIQKLYSNGYAITKEDYTKALRTYQTYLGEIKSRQRDEAAAADEDYRYY